MQIEVLPFRTTKSYYFDLANGRYSTARAELHDEIIQKAFESLKPSTAFCKPFYFATWGGANTAKSVVVDVLKKLNVIPKNYVYIGMHLFEEVPEFQEIKKLRQDPHPEKSPELIDEFYDVVEKIVGIAKDLNVSIVFDDHGDQVEQYSKHIQLVQAGNTPPYETVLWGHAIDPNFFMWYMEKKIQEGKPVAREQIPYAIKLFQRLSETLLHLSQIFDFVALNEAHASLTKYPKLIGLTSKNAKNTWNSFDEKAYCQTVLAWLGANPEAMYLDPRKGLTLWGQGSSEPFAKYRRGDAYVPIQTSYNNLSHNQEYQHAFAFTEDLSTRIKLYYALSGKL